MYVEDTFSNMDDIPSYPGALSFKDIIIWLISPLATVSKKIYCSILLPIKVTGRFHTWRNAVFMQRVRKGLQTLSTGNIDWSIDWLTSLQGCNLHCDLVLQFSEANSKHVLVPEISRRVFRPKYQSRERLLVIQMAFSYRSCQPPEGSSLVSDNAFISEFRKGPRGGLVVPVVFILYWPQFSVTFPAAIGKINQ